MSARPAAAPPAVLRARHEPARVCVHCDEPLVRLQCDVSRQVSTWLHTPGRLHCLNRFREVQATVAQPREVAA